MATTPDLRELGGAEALLRTCPSFNVLEVLASKWTILVLAALHDGPLRFGELRRLLDGITQKSLTQALRTLERDGLLTRAHYPTIPPRVEYTLTDLGYRARDLLKGMQQWAVTNLPEVEAARTAYDARAAAEPRFTDLPTTRRAN